MTNLLAEPVVTTMTLQEFLDFDEQHENEDDSHSYELDEGELITLSRTGYAHGRRVMMIGAYLLGCLDQTRYDVIGGEAGIIMEFDPKPTVREMDIAVLHRPEEPPKGILRHAPLLIVEVISPSNTAIDMERKRKQYHQFGVGEVWFIYEETQSVHVSRHEPQEFFICENPGVFTSSIGLTIETKDLFV